MHENLGDDPTVLDSMTVRLVAVGQRPAVSLVGVAVQR